MTTAARDDSQIHEQALELLLTCLPDEPDRFREVCRRVEDWDQVFKYALLHGVESLLCHYLANAGITLPPEVEKNTERWMNVRMLWQSHARRTLDEALHALDSVSVRTVALKGPLLGERLYPNPFARPSADLDLLVARADLDKATAALASIGYRQRIESQARFLRKFHYHIILSRSSPPMIELHFSLTDRFGVEIPAEEFLFRASPYRAENGARAYILSPEDELLYLSIHAAGHRFMRLSWLWDIKLLLRQHPDIDWGTIVTRARSLGLLSALLYTCEILQRKLGVKLENRAIMARRVRSSIADFLLAVTARQPEFSRGSLLGKMAFTTVLCDRPGSAAGFLRRQALFIMRRRARRHFPSLVPEEWSY